MKRPRKILILAICIAGCAGYLARVSDHFVEVNRVTGATRSRMRHAFVFNSPWKEEPTWVSESALHQGISTENGWQYLACCSVRLLSITNEDGYKPVSWYVRTVWPEELGLNASGEIDRFTRNFVSAPELEQRQMLRLPTK